MRDNRRTTESQKKTYEELITETEKHWERILEMLSDTEVGENREREREVARSRHVLRDKNIGL